MQSDPFDFELAAGRWALRAFWFLGGVTASVIIGYGLVPAISNVAFIVAVALFICAVLCNLVMIVRLVQYGFARRARYHQVSTTLGAPYARELRQSEKPAWWNRLTRLGKATYWIGVLIVALLVTVAPRIGRGSAPLAILFIVVVAALFGGLRFLRR